MAEAILNTDAERLLRQYPAHPATDRVLYMPEEPQVITPLIREGWIDAAIVPADDALKAELQAPQNIIKSSQIQKRPGIIKTDISVPLPTGVNNFGHKLLGKCAQYFNVAGYHDERIQRYIFAYPEGSTTSLEQKLHRDNKLDIIAYIAVSGAPLEFLTKTVPEGRLGGILYGHETWEEQQQYMQEIGMGDNPDDYLASIELGDMIIFGPGLIHKSSRYVQNGPNHTGKGLVAYSYNSLPPQP